MYSASVSSRPPLIALLVLAACGSPETTRGSPAAPAPRATPATPATTAAEASACDGVASTVVAAQRLAFGDGARDYVAAAKGFAAACACDDGAGCYHLGIALRHARGVAPDQSAALAAFRRGCEAGYGPACAQEAWAHREGTLGLEPDPRRADPIFARARPLLQAGCAAGDPSSCFDLGHLWRFGLVVDEDLEQATSLFAGACDAGLHDACYMLAVMAHEQALALIEEHCPRPVQRSCLNRVPGAAGLKEAVRALYERRRQALRETCDRGHYGACATLPDAARVAAVQEAECRSGNYGACIDVAAAHPARAESLLAPACRRRVGEACAILGRRHRDGDGTDVDLARARSYLRKACDAGWAAACADLAD